VDIKARLRQHLLRSQKEEVWRDSFAVITVAGEDGELGKCRELIERICSKTRDDGVYQFRFNRNMQIGHVQSMQGADKKGYTQM
jgi:hypothetical protein